MIATFYYLLNAILVLKGMGAKDYFKESWNIVDVATIALSLVTIILWLIKVIFFNIGSNIVQRGGDKAATSGKNPMYAPD